MGSGVEDKEVDGVFEGDGVRVGVAVRKEESVREGVRLPVLLGVPVRLTEMDLEAVSVRDDVFSLRGKGE